MKTLIYLFISILLFSKASAQVVLNNYLVKGIAQNETIKQQEFALENSLIALKEAKSLFLPNVSFNSIYTLADGGRTVDFPVGDLLNPVYQTLNQLTNSKSFSSQQNRSILLNPNNFYDIKLHTTYPIINSELVYNQRIKSQQIDLQKLQVVIFKRELTKEIKIAYYQYFKLGGAIEIYKNTLQLVKENLRINQSLFKNYKVNRTVVLRSDNEVSKINAQLEAAIQEQKSAKAYFNFLLNQPLNSSIDIDTIQSIPELQLKNQTSEKREEIQKLEIAKEINKNMIRLSSSYSFPKLNSFLDFGTQGFDFKVNEKTPYYFLGLSLEWNIFAGNKNKFKVKQAEAELKITESHAANLTQQLDLQLQVAKNNLSSTISNYHAAQAQINSTEKYYQDELKLYKEGTTLFIELLDAQNQWLNAKLQANIYRFDTLIKQVEIERANASLIIP